jgi:hypothetical protein
MDASLTSTDWPIALDAFKQIAKPSFLTNALNKTTALTYELGDLTKVKDPLNRETHRMLDAARRLCSVINPIGQKTVESTQWGLACVMTYRHPDACISTAANHIKTGGTFVRSNIPRVLTTTNYSTNNQ